MSRTTSSGPDTAREIHEQLVDMICADDDLTRIEFSAIIEAGWGGDSSPPQPGQGKDPDEPAEGRRGPSAAEDAVPPTARMMPAGANLLGRRPRAPPGQQERESSHTAQHQEKAPELLKLQEGGVEGRPERVRIR